MAAIIGLLNFKEFDEYCSNYSHGMNKKLNICISFLLDLPIQLYDEALSGIDPKSLRHIYNHFNKIKSNKIIIMSTHSKELVDEIVDELLFVDNGEIKELIVEKYNYL